MILIADDNPRMRETIKMMLVDAGPDFIECADGAEVLALYRKHKPDWVLMDIRMGAMDGIAATREVTSAFPNARIIIVTNYNDSFLRAEAEEAGAVGYVLKDDLSELVQVITDPSKTMKSASP
jgi:CheY-like chemotaxis protein